MLAQHDLIVLHVGVIVHSDGFLQNLKNCLFFPKVHTQTQKNLNVMCSTHFIFQVGDFTKEYGTYIGDFKVNLPRLYRPFFQVVKKIKKKMTSLFRPTHMVSEVTSTLSTRTIFS